VKKKLNKCGLKQNK